MAAISKELREMSQQPWFPIMMRELGYEPINADKDLRDYEKKLYPCDPSKNKECNKRGCYLNGGPCRSTTHAEYCDAGDFISKQALLYALDDMEPIEDGDVDINELEDLIKRLPTIEAEPIKNGKWLKTAQSLVFPEKFRNYFCSECGFELDKSIRTAFRYCPNCGAKMDEVEE